MLLLCMHVRGTGAYLPVKKYNILREIEISTYLNKYVKTNKMISAGSFEMLITTYKITEVITQSINILRI